MYPDAFPVNVYAFYSVTRSGVYHTVQHSTVSKYTTVLVICSVYSISPKACALYRTVHIHRRHHRILSPLHLAARRRDNRSAVGIALDRCTHLLR